MNQVYYLFEFLGKISQQAISEGDECIIVANSKISEFSKRQYFSKDIRFFSKVDWLIENYKKDENEFGDLSWREFFPTFNRRCETAKFNYNDSVKIISQLYQFIDFIFQKEKPDVVVNEAPANLFTEIAYHLCRKYNITYLGFVGSRFNKRLDIYDLEHTCSKYEKTFREINSDNIPEDEKNSAKDLIKNFLSHKQIPSYMEYQIRNIQLGEISRIKRYIKEEKEMFPFWIKYISKRKKFGSFDYQSRAQFKWNLLRPWTALKTKFRALSQKNIFDSFNDKDKFFIYPLHLQREASTLVRAMYFCDQLNTIKNIAFSLPFPCKLYVKEHISAIGTNSGHFYKKIKEIPNTVLIPPYENVENLIKKSQGVIVLTSTMGMEAALAGKPAYALGDVFYDYHPLCKKVNSFEELRQKIKEDIANGPAVNDLENINIRFITSYFRNTIPGNTVIASSKNDTNDYKEIYKTIKRMFFENEKYSM